MATCKNVFDFLTQVSNRAVTTPLAAADAQHLSDLGIVKILSSEQFRQLTEDVQTLDAVRAALAQELQERAQLAGTLSLDVHQTHSVLFHLHGKDKQTDELQQESRDRASFQTLESDLVQKEAAFNDLVAKRSLADTLSPYGDEYVGLTSVGVLELRNLGLRLYRFGDTDFDTYWNQWQRVGQELTGLALGGSNYFARLAQNLSDADRSYLWAISIGLTKVQPDLDVGVPRFLEAYNGTASFSGNSENRLMASEIMFALARPVADQLPLLSQLLPLVRNASVPSASALGVAAILLFGQRGDGTFATSNLEWFLHLTKSYEAAAMLAIYNAPVDQLASKFQSLRTMFGSWGYEPSEDVELSSAYLTVSELPVEGMSTKLSIIARGMSTYLQYPLVAASILSSVPTLEANETLNLVEQAYNIVGQRAVGLSQPELICLAVRMVHGIRNELVGTLDATAAAPAAPTGGVSPYYGPRFFFLPVVVAHSTYFSTYSGIAGAHPAHVHGVVGGGIGGGGMG